MRRVVVTGLGFITSIGNSRGEVLASLRELRHGCVRGGMVPGVELPVRVAAPVRGFDVTSPNANAWTWPADYALDRTLVRVRSRRMACMPRARSRRRSRRAGSRRRNCATA